MKIDNIKRKVRKLFLSGNRYTAVEINRIIGFADSRKVISSLRREGFNIVDEVSEIDNHKTYWVNPCDIQKYISMNNQNKLNK